MGSVTPVLLYNDTIHMMTEDPHFTQELYNAISRSGRDGADRDVSLRSYRKTWFDHVLNFFGLSRMPNPKSWRGSASFAQVLPTRHADVASTLVCKGNTWMDLTEARWDLDWNLHRTDKTPRGRMDKTYIDYIRSCVQTAEYDVKEMKKLLKELDAKNKEATK